GPGCADAVLRFLRKPGSLAAGAPELPERRAVLAEAVDGAEVLDEVLAVRFAPGRSYTGEEMVELSAHGSSFVMERLAALACLHGARPARPGEFTQRAFLNGRIDLLQAEAVCDLIASRSRRAHRSASLRLGGGLSREIGRLRSEITGCLALCEAAIDHPEEAPQSLSGPRLSDSLEGAASLLDSLLRAQGRGRFQREGLRVALIGRPNAGKSTLFNALLGRERAIVSSAPGTTRDTLEESAELGGACAVLMDTAGLRPFAPKRRSVEALGMRRSESALEAADLALLVLDLGRPLRGQGALLRRLACEPDRPVLVALNKSDLPRRAFTREALAREFPGVDALEVSALRSEGLEALEERLAALLSGGAGGPAEETGVEAVSRRHRDALRASLSELEEARALLRAGKEPELAAPSLRGALGSLDEITGRTTTEDVLGEIFSRFCIGK
ncbi:MAG: tRNA uridine-5-carboxymethylaminomethyl(34) synthesis GTPase MnmE, partial [Elusimicrobiota bacterium]